MRKEDWSRKPKEAFKKTKDRYGERRGHSPETQQSTEAVTTNFDELARLRKQHERRFNRGANITKLIFGIGMLILLGLLYYSVVKGLEYR